jgi:hypothetical protein
MNIVRIHKRQDSRRGTALAMIVLCVSALAALSAALLSVSVSNSREQRGEKQEIHASYVCQAGLSQAMYQLQRGLTGNVGSQGTPATWGPAHVWVQATNVTSDIVRLRATGIEDEAGASQELVVRAVPNTIWRYGAFGKEFLHMDSNARVDSYNSDLGTYAAQAVNGSGSSQYALTNGDVGSNGDISIDQNAKVWGDAVAGPSHTTTVLGNAVVTGSTTPASQQVELPSINVPTYTNYGNLTVSSNTSWTSSNRTYGTLRVGSNKTLTIRGPANIVASSLTLNSGAKIVVDATNGPVTFYVVDNFIMNSNAQIYSTDYKPSKVKLNLLSDNVINPEVQVTLDTVDFDSNSQVWGTVYAPNARIVFDSNFQLYGSIMARSLDVDSNSRFHFDEALINATANGVPTYETLCWREIPFQN